MNGGVLPDSGFPRVSGKETSDNSNTVQTRASHSTHAFGHGRRLDGIPSKRAFSERVESEVEVVVHDDGRGTRDGSRSRSRYTGLRRRSSYMVRSGTCIFGLDESEGFG